MKPRHYFHCKLAGFTYWEGAQAFEHLKVGTLLRLKREKKNKFDPYAVAVYFENFKLGFLPRGENQEISKFLELGWNMFETRIQKLDPQAHPEEQIHLIVHILPNPEFKKEEKR